jgi:hypothetical protein
MIRASKNEESGYSRGWKQCLITRSERNDWRQPEVMFIFLWLFMKLVAAAFFAKGGVCYSVHYVALCTARCRIPVSTCRSTAISGIPATRKKIGWR